MPSISVNPDPLVAGQAGSVCYDFTGSSNSSVDLEIDWTPGGNQTVTVTDNGTPGPVCASIPGGVPANAESFTIADQTGSAPDYGDFVEDPPPGGI